MIEQHESESRNKLIFRTNIVGIISNIILAAFKIVVGLISKSIVITLDGINNVNDALSSVVGLIGMKIASKPADKEHPFGHGRVEYLSSILIAALILFTGVNFIITSIKKIINPEAPDYTIITVILLVVAIIAKLFLGSYTKKMGKKADSDALIATGLDAIFDAIISLSTLVSVVITLIWGVVIEGYLGVIISIWIIKTAIKLLLETIHILIGPRIDTDLSKQIKEEIKKEDGVLGAYDLTLHNYGPTQFMGAVNIEIYDYMTAKQIFFMTKEIQRKIRKKFNAILTVGIYAVNTDDKHISGLEEPIRKIVLSNEHVMQVHAFYVDLNRKLISFDMVIDFCAHDVSKIYNNVVTTLKEKYPEYKFEIHVDRNISD